MRDIGTNIRAARNVKGLTQDELAERIHTTRQTVSNYETGRSQPDLETLSLLAEALECDEERLLYGKARPATDPREVRRLVIAAPRGGAELAARLRWELGIPILPPESEAGVAVCFAPEEDVPAQSVLALHGAWPGLGGLELTAPGLREGDRGDLPLLTALWEGGRLTERDLKIT